MTAFRDEADGVVEDDGIGGWPRGDEVEEGLKVQNVMAFLHKMHVCPDILHVKPRNRLRCHGFCAGSSFRGTSNLLEDHALAGDFYRTLPWNIRTARSSHSHAGGRSFRRGTP